ncbi:MAG: BlaI/MecI/CopY family transcriptional regulator [Ruminococcaceae bacterium]|nr:BlaI/MecI/CopY family transcriptional regulator [Oscillospiraceae bacterium]
MAEIKLGEIESRFAEIIWTNEPLSSSQLAKMAEAELGWKKSTTYTILKRLCDRGIFRNQNGTVSSLITKNEFYAMQSEKFVDESFDGSLPAFLTAFSMRKKYTDEEVEKMKQILDSMRG